MRPEHWRFTIPLRLRSLFRWVQADQELDDELRDHLERKTEEYVAKGMAQEAARRRARLDIGGIEQTKEKCRDARRVNWIQDFVQDLHYGLRVLRKSPGFTAVAILTLALGIGANTAIFSLIDAALIKMLPVKSPEQLVRLKKVTADGKINSSFSYPTFRLLQDDNQAPLSGVLAFRDMGNLDCAANGEAGLAKGQVVSGSYFPVLGVHPFLGRLLSPDDDRTAGGSPVAVISHSYWTERFHREPSVVGKRITLNGSAFTIIGVTPPEFFGLQPGKSVDVSVPLTMTAALDPRQYGEPILTAPFRNWLFIMARLKLGVTEEMALASLGPAFEQAQREAAARSGLAFDSPGSRKMVQETRLRLEPGNQGLAALRERFSKPLLVLMAIVSLLLLIACANVANLLLARANARQKEAALRLALGAGRLRLVRQMLTESGLLAILGGALGLLFAFWGTSLLLGLLSRSSSPVLLNVRPDARVLGFTLMVSVIAALIFGLVPAWRSSKAELTHDLKEAGVSLGSGRQRSRLGKALAVAQIALSFVMLVGAGLLVRTLRKLQELSPGFNRENVLLFSVAPGMLRYENAQITELYSRLLERIRALPGVRAASFSMFSPLGQRFTFTDTTVEGYTPRAGQQNTPVSINFVGPAYFKTLGTKVILGRDFTDSDRAGALKVAVINEAMAHFFFGDSNPLGRRFSIPAWIGDKSMLEIVGVIEDTKSLNLRESAPPSAFIPFFQSPDTHTVTFDVRTNANPDSLIASVRGVVHEVDRRLPAFDVKTLDMQVDESLIQERLVASLSTLFGGLALLLTCVGLYGLISYSVGRRTHEIGVRMALGASRGEVLRLVMGEGLRLAVIGVSLGLVGALGATRFLTSLLYGIEPTDPLAFTVVPLLLTVVALLACYIPAQRATRVDPIAALRYE